MRSCSSIPTIVPQAEALVCIADNDDQRDPDAKMILRKASDGAKLAVDIEVSPAQHGFCVVDSPVSDRTQAERAWSKMLAMFRRSL